jgi:hypothetical protein
MTLHATVGMRVRVSLVLVGLALVSVCGSLPARALSMPSAPVPPPTTTVPNEPVNVPPEVSQAIQIIQNNPIPPSILAQMPPELQQVYGVLGSVNPNGPIPSSALSAMALLSNPAIMSMMPPQAQTALSIFSTATSNPLVSSFLQNQGLGFLTGLGGLGGLSGGLGGLFNSIPGLSGLPGLGGLSSLLSGIPGLSNLMNFIPGVGPILNSLFGGLLGPPPATEPKQDVQIQQLDTIIQRLTRILEEAEKIERNTRKTEGHTQAALKLEMLRSQAAFKLNQLSTFLSSGIILIGQEQPPIMGRWGDFKDEVVSKFSGSHTKMGIYRNDATNDTKNRAYALGGIFRAVPLTGWDLDPENPENVIGNGAGANTGAYISPQYGMPIDLLTLPGRVTWVKPEDIRNKIFRSYAFIKEAGPAGLNSLSFGIGWPFNGGSGGRFGLANTRLAVTYYFTELTNYTQIAAGAGNNKPGWFAILPRVPKIDPEKPPLPLAPGVYLRPLSDGNGRLDGAYQKLCVEYPAPENRLLFLHILNENYPGQSYDPRVGLVQSQGNFIMLEPGYDPFTVENILSGGIASFYQNIMPGSKSGYTDLETGWVYPTLKSVINSNLMKFEVDNDLWRQRQIRKSSDGVNNDEVKDIAKYDIVPFSHRNERKDSGGGVYKDWNPPATKGNSAVDAELQKMEANWESYDPGFKEAKDLAQKAKQQYLAYNEERADVAQRVINANPNGALQGEGPTPEELKEWCSIRNAIRFQITRKEIEKERYFFEIQFNQDLALIIGQMMGALDKLRVYIEAIPETKEGFNNNWYTAYHEPWEDQKETYRAIDYQILKNQFKERRAIPEIAQMQLDCRRYYTELMQNIHDMKQEMSKIEQDIHNHLMELDERKIAMDKRVMERMTKTEQEIRTSQISGQW